MPCPKCGEEKEMREIMPAGREIIDGTIYGPIYKDTFLNQCDACKTVFVE